MGTRATENYYCRGTTCCVVLTSNETARYSTTQKWRLRSDNVVGVLLSTSDTLHWWHLAACVWCECMRFSGPINSDRVALFRQQQVRQAADDRANQAAERIYNMLTSTQLLNKIKPTTAPTHKHTHYATTVWLTDNTTANQSTPHNSRWHTATQALHRQQALCFTQCLTTGT